MVRLSHRIAAGFLLSVIMYCFVIPLLPWVPGPTGGSVADSHLPLFSPGHILGTDSDGNDILARLASGGRTSLQIALIAILTGAAVGGFLGSLSALLGGRVDVLTARLIEMWLAFPSLVLALVVAQSAGPGALQTALVLVTVGIPAFARVTRTATLAIRDQPFMVAASLNGTSMLACLRTHVTPLVGPQVATYGILRIGSVMILEGALSLIGLGVQPPSPSWGNMIADGQNSLLTHPKLLFITAVTMFLTLLSINIIGDMLRDRWHSRY